MSQLIQPRLLRGFRDYLPGVMAQREKMVATVTEVFQRFGFSPLATPCIEYSDILLGKYGDEAEMLLYRFRDNGDRDVSLRYDLTVPLARVVAQYADLPRPFKRYQIAPVWRAEKPGRGRFREFVQCDVDIVGADSLAADAECVQVDNAALSALGVERFHIRLNNRKVLAGLSALAGDADAARMKGVFRTIDKLERQGADVVQELLVKESGLSTEEADAILRFLTIEGSNEERLARAGEIIGHVETARQGLEELRNVAELSAAGGTPAERVVVDLSIARGLDYYTGTVFETTLDDLPQVGSVMSGGRYDDLISLFTGKDLPAVGISIGLDRLLSALQELGRVDADAACVDVFVTVFSDELRKDSTALAARLRAAGLRVVIAFTAGKLGKQFKLADRLGARVALALGPDEAASGTVTIKDLRARTQETVPADQTEQRIRKALDAEA